MVCVRCSLVRKASPMQVYMRGPRTQENQPLHEFTLMPMRMTSLFSVDDLQEDSWHEFTSEGPGQEGIRAGDWGFMKG